MTRHYKFIGDPGVVPFLVKGIVKVTPIPELNDPSELTSNVIANDVVESLHRLRREGYTEDDLVHLRRQGKLLERLAPQFQAVPVPRTREEATRLIQSSFYDTTSVLEALLEKTADEMSSKVGLLCVSRRYDSLPMWAHYASNATGLVVEFVCLDRIFAGDDTGILAQPITVRYGREARGVTFDPRSHEALFFEKFQDWSYEQEVRVVLPLTDCMQRDIAGKRLYLYQIPLDCVSRLFLGWRMRTETVDEIRAHVRSENPRVEVVQVRFERGHVTVGEAAMNMPAPAL